MNARYRWPGIVALACVLAGIGCGGAQGEADRPATSKHEPIATGSEPAVVPIEPLGTAPRATAPDLEGDGPPEPQPAAGEPPPASDSDAIPPTGIGACDRYFAAVKRCLQDAPPEARRAFREAIQVFIDQIHTATDEASHETVARTCATAADALERNPMCQSEEEAEPPDAAK